MRKLYLLSFGAQKDIVEKNCFDCGKIIVGGITFMDAMWFPCREDKCPIEDSTLDMGVCDMDGGSKDHVFVRKLKS